jgi:copper(I)-binding protein
MMRSLPLLLLAALLAPHVQATQAEQVKASHAWIRLLPADLPAGGYVLLDNHGSVSATLVSARSSAYASVMLHQSTMDAQSGNHMHMVDQLVVPAHGQVALAPAGYHLMLEKATHPLKPGDLVGVTFDFADGSHLQVPFLVRPANAVE